MDDLELKEALIASFKEEALEHLQVLEKTLGELEKQGEALPQTTIQEMFRAAHSLKGSARAVEYIQIQCLFQGIEDLFGKLKKKEVEITPPLINALSDAYRATEEWITEQVPIDVEAHLNALQGGPQVKMEQQPTQVKPQKKEDSIRIASKKINALMSQVEEMLLIKLASKEKLSLLKEIELNLESESPSKIKEKIQSLIQMQEKQARFFNGLIDQVMESSKEILMLPLATILHKFPHMVRDLSRSLNKEASLEIQGDEIEVDRRILETISDPLVHLVRNSLDHGIEAPDERIKKSKSSNGNITIAASMVDGKTFKLSIKDDGRGFDLEKIKEKAKKTGLVSEKELQTMTEEEISALIFKPSFSTSDIVTEISGRGVGLDVVFENVEKLGGKITYTSQKDQGCAFEIEMPLTLATFRGILIEVSGRSFILPTERVERMIRVNRSEIKTIEGHPIVTVGQISYPLLSLATLLGLEDNIKKLKQFFVVLLKAAKTTIAVALDSVIKEDEVFVKRLSDPLERVKNISGVTVIEGEKIVPILHPFDLIKHSVGKKERFEEESQKEIKQKIKILIVEDSSTTRMLLKNILESAGFSVRIAIDGKDAVTALKKEIVDLILSDVEMPAMNGFELTETIRKTEEWKELPVILCTSLGSKEDREHGIRSGANAYIDKSSFTHTGLIDIIEQFIGRS